MLQIVLIGIILVFQVTQGTSEEIELNPTVIENLSKLVLSGNYSEVIAIIDYLDPYYREVIKHSYNNDIKNVDAILKFIEDCPGLYKQEGYDELTKAMKANNDLWSNQGFSLAAAIRAFDQSSQLDEFPTSTRLLYFWGGNCKLKNKHFGEYFYAADQWYKYDKYHRNIFTYIKRTADIKMDFDIRRVYNNVFTLRSVKFNEYLFAEEDNYAYDGSRRRAFTYRSKKSIPGNREWKIEPKYREQDVIQLRNVRFGERLFVDAGLRRDKDRRLVFTERNAGFAHENLASWYMVC